MYSTLSSAPDSAAAATALASRSPTVVRRNSASIWLFFAPTALRYTRVRPV